MPGTAAENESGTEGTPNLTEFQLEVARLFFSLTASKGFLLAGGAALLAQHLTTRPTEDLDFFTTPEHGHVSVACNALEVAARECGWRTERIHDTETFCRLVIRSDTAEVLTDLAVNAPPDFPPSLTAAGPTLAPEELAGHKLLALYDRAAARDFVDVYLLACGSAETFSWLARHRSTLALTPGSWPTWSPPWIGSRTTKYRRPAACQPPSSGPSTRLGGLN
jgi:hypothetical protein